MTKIAVCLPTGHVMPSKTAISLAHMMLWTPGTVPGVEIGILHAEGAYIAHARCELTRDALAAGFDALMWIDHDQTFPPDGLARLLAHNVPLVGATYRTRTPPDYKYMLPAGEEIGNGLAKVEYLPHGFTLVRREVYEKIGFPYYQAMYGTKPEDPGLFIGEDVYFGRVVKQYGIDWLCDLKLSLEIGHILGIELRRDTHIPGV